MDWHFHFDVLLLCLLIEGAYLLAVGPWRRLFVYPDIVKPKRGQIAWFTAAVFTLFLAQGTPLHDLSERFLFSAHMTQHTLLTLVLPPFLLLGLPAWLLRPVLVNTVLERPARFLVHPLVAFAFFNGLTTITHFPFVTEWTLRNHTGHVFVHALLIFSATLMWWPILSPLPEWRRLNYPARMLYLFAQSLVPAVIGAFLTFASGPFYRFYAEAPRLWNISPVTDQQMAGLIMKILGSLILWIAAAIIFFQWFRREEAGVTQEVEVPERIGQP